MSAGQDTAGLFASEAFEQIPGQMSMAQVEPTFDLWYELYDRNGYMLSRARNTFRGSCVADAVRQAERSAATRGLEAEITFVQQVQS